MSQSLVRHFMTSPVKTVAVDFPLEQAARIMCDEQISCLIVNENEAPVGILTERDITRAVATNPSGAAGVLVHEIMTVGIKTITIDASSTEALALLKNNGIRRCVIVNAAGKTCGVITQTDLLRAHARDIEIQKQVLEDRVSERTRELQMLNTRLETLSLVDPLLEIGNRRAMNNALRQLQERIARHGSRYAIALIDVDFFKAYNDHYGHLAGDKALKLLVSTINDNIRVADSLFRYGGEEFLAVFPDESLEDAAISAERVRQGIEERAYEHVESPLGMLTVSIGVAACRFESENWETVLSKADSALYAAKNSGKNRTETFAAVTPTHTASPQTG